MVNPFPRIKREKLWLQPCGHNARVDCLQCHKRGLSTPWVADWRNTTSIRGPGTPRGVPSPPTRTLAGWVYLAPGMGLGL